jgi:hypothetical protein
MRSFEWWHFEVAAATMSCVEERAPGLPQRMLNGITDIGDRVLIALRACQAYVRALER